MEEDRGRLPLEYASPRSRERPATEPPPPPSRLKFRVLWITGRAWLLIALALFLGQTFQRSSPTRYSAFGLGGWFSDRQYLALVLACAGVGIVSLALGWRHGKGV